jgi:hypothetical protein
MGPVALAARAALATCAEAPATARIVSDAKGEFQAYTGPGRINVSILRVPLPWLPPFQEYRGEEIPDGRKALPIRFDHSLPVPAATVSCMHRDEFPRAARGFVIQYTLTHKRRHE